MNDNSKTPVYGGSLTREQFLYYEHRIVAKLILKGMSYDEILKECTDENLFQYPSTVSYKLITRACYNRLTFTGDNRLVDIIANSTTSTSKLALLYAMMCQNLLVRDFMIEVIGEKFQSRVLSFDKTDVNHFFVQLSGRIDSVSTWSDSTIGKIKSVLIKCLAETGYLNTIRSTELNQVNADEELIQLIRDRGDYEFLCAFNEI